MFDTSDFECVDCKSDTDRSNEYYMVHDKLWLEANMEPDGGMLCVGCLEERLKRRLMPSDFTKFPVNTMFPASSRLADRQGRKVPHYA